MCTAINTNNDQYDDLILHTPLKIVQLKSPRFMIDKWLTHKNNDCLHDNEQV